MLLQTLKTAAERIRIICLPPAQIHAQWVIDPHGLRFDAGTPFGCQSAYLAWVEIETAVDLDTLLQRTETKVLTNLKGT